MAEHTEPVIIVGAGLAGLHAAWRLSQSGVEVMVLEARDRVGGRTWSTTLSNGTIVERGGEFITPTDSCLRDLCDELDLTLIPHGFSFDCRTSPGNTPPTYADIQAVADAARAEVASWDHDAPASAALPAPAERDPVQDSVIRRIETSSTVPLDMTSGRYVFGAGEISRHDPSSRVLGGNDSVARELARRLGDRVHLRSPVTAVHHDRQGVSVGLHDGRWFTGAAAVLAVPLPLLLSLDLQPALSPEITKAAEHRCFGDAAKLHLPLERPAAPNGVVALDALWWCWVSEAAQGGEGAPALSAFAGGVAAVAAVNARSGGESWRTQALRRWPDVSPDGSPLVTHWGSERWTRGSYSDAGVGISTADDEAWTKAYGRLVFAGEHTAGSQAATMNGAAASGKRAALVVMESLQRG